MISIRRTAELVYTEQCELNIDVAMEARYALELEAPIENDVVCRAHPAQICNLKRSFRNEWMALDSTPNGFKVHGIEFVSDLALDESTWQMSTHITRDEFTKPEWIEDGRQYNLKVTWGKAW